MANSRVGYGCSQQASSGRPKRSRHKPPMTTTAGAAPNTKYPYMYWARDNWVPLPIGLRHPPGDYISISGRFSSHTVDGIPSGYEVFYICPEGYRAKIDISLNPSSILATTKISVAVVTAGRMGGPTPVESFILRNASFYHDENPYMIRNIMLGPGDEIRVWVDNTYITYWTLTGLISGV